MSTTNLKIILALLCLLLVYMIQEMEISRQKMIKNQNRNLKNIEAFKEILASGRDMPFLSNNAAVVSAYCFRDIEQRMQSCNIKVEQKQMLEALPMEKGFFKIQSFAYQLFSPDLPALHKLLHSLENSSNHLYNVERVEIQPAEQNEQKSGYKVSLTLTAYLINL